MIEKGDASFKYLEIWSRQIPLFEEDLSDQKKLYSARISVVGAGGLGSSFLYYVSAAGVGNIQILDFQNVEVSNLNRQILYTLKDVGRKKATAAAERLKKLAPEVNFLIVEKRVEDATHEIAEFKPDVLIDCTDNLSARFFLNRLSIELSIPLVYAMVRGYEGMVGAVYPLESACLECFLKEKKSKEETPPVVGFTPGIAGCIEAAICMEILFKRKPFFNEFLHFDLKTFDFSKIAVKKDTRCSACGKN